MVSTHLGGATAERGGRRKRLVTITAYGQRTLLGFARPFAIKRKPTVRRSYLCFELIVSEKVQFLSQT